MNQINPVQQKKPYTLLSPENQAILKDGASYALIIGATWAGLKYGVYHNPARQELLRLTAPAIPHFDAYTIRRAYTTLFPAPKQSELPSATPLLAASTPLHQLLISAMSSTSGIKLESKRSWLSEEEGIIQSVHHHLHDKDVMNSIFQTKKAANRWRQSLKPYLHREDFSDTTTKTLQNAYKILGRKNKNNYANAVNFRRALTSGWTISSQSQEEKVKQNMVQLLNKDVLKSIYKSKTVSDDWRKSLKPYLLREDFSADTIITARKAYLILGRKNKNRYATSAEFQREMRNSLNNTGTMKTLVRK